MILSVLSSPAFVSGLMVARAKNPVHSVLFSIPVFCDTSGLLLLLGLDFSFFGGFGQEGQKRCFLSVKSRYRSPPCSHGPLTEE